jgi:hypothetical protein
MKFSEIQKRNRWKGWREVKTNEIEMNEIQFDYHYKAKAANR